jgi:hypothetical protein
MKDFITTLSGLPPTLVANQIAELYEQVIIQATTFAEVRERNSALMKEERKLVKNKTNLDKGFALIQQLIMDLEARVFFCMHEDLQAKIMQLEQQLAWGIPVDIEELKQQLKDAQKQLKVVGEE